MTDMAERAGRQLSLSEVYRHFGDTDVKGSSPLYERVALAIAESTAALAVVEQAPPLKRHPTVILAALHDQVLRGHAPDLAAAYASSDLDDVGLLAVDALVARADAIVATAAARQTQTNETGRAALLYPAIALAAERVGAETVGLVDVGCSAGLNLNLDHVAISYSNGAVLGDRSSALRLECDLVGEAGVPTRSLPGVVARIGIDLSPVDISDPDDARWLRACLWPDQPERIARLDAAMTLARANPPELLAGNALDVLPDAAQRVPDDALLVVMTTWALAYFELGDRLRFLRRLDEIAARRAVAWISGEGVGIAPGVPTLGDSRRAAHSLVGLSLGEHRRMTFETIGRCHPHGRWLEWLA
ncbi:MAG: DUF2332 domain-containing protein [Acidimicrobiales bacterium]|nr:DUF2332 domain-containing protein [Acidimicrobiales bacterium]